MGGSPRYERGKTYLLREKALHRAFQRGRKPPTMPPLSPSDATWPLERDEVHLWWTRGADGDLAREGRGWLSDEECARCERFRREEDARIFTAARVFLRGTLAGYIGREPAELVFEE